MTLRTRLTATLFFLAVVPLAGTTIYSYLSSRRAYETAVAAEAATLAGEMPGRMTSLTDDLSRRIARLEDVPFSTLREMPRVTGEAPQSEVYRRLDVELGPVVDLIEALEFTPAARPGPPGFKRPPPPLPPSASDHGETDELVLTPQPVQRPPGAWTQEGGKRWMLRAIAGPEEAAAFQREVEEAAKAAEKEARAAQAQALALAARAAQHAPGAEGPPQVPPRGGRAERWRLRVPGAAESGAPSFALHHEFTCTTKKGGTPVGRLKARVPAEKVLLHVLAGSRRDASEVVFAIDAQGTMRSSEIDSGKLAEIAALVKGASAPGEKLLAAGDWIIAMHRDAVSGLTWGVARPIDAALRAIRATAVRNFLLGLVVVGLAMAGSIPLSRRLTRDVADLTENVARLGQGDFAARVPVRSKDEIGRLAETFNRMAEELRAHQERVVEQERMRRELELCRRIQEEMLPHAPLRFAFAEAQGISLPAREVGGDFFNYFALASGEAALLVGDVSGKGVPAALLMANVQATLRARLPLTRDLAQLAAELDHEIEAATPRPTYLTLFVGILDAERKVLRYVNAGQNPPILVRAGGESLRLDPTGRPLALLSGGAYEERSVAIGDGDAFVLYTDGLVESENAGGEPFGLARLERVLAAERASSSATILARIDEAVRTHRAGTEPADDATVVVLRVGPVAQA